MKLAYEPPQIDILERLAAEGPTDEIRSAIIAELEKLHELDARLQRRAAMLEEAKATWMEAPGSAVSRPELGKAAE